MSILRAQSLAGFLDSAMMKIGGLISVSSTNNEAESFDIQFLVTRFRKTLNKRLWLALQDEQESLL